MPYGIRLKMYFFSPKTTFCHRFLPPVSRFFFKFPCLLRVYYATDSRCPVPMGVQQCPVCLAKTWQQPAQICPALSCRRDCRRVVAVLAGPGGSLAGPDGCRAGWFLPFLKLPSRSLVEEVMWRRAGSAPSLEP